MPDEYTPQQNPLTGNTNADKPGGFEVAALIFGILSLVALCTGIFAISFGCLGVLFAILSRKKDRPMATMTYAGMCMSIAGIILGTTLTFYVIVSVIIPMLNDPQAFSELNTFYQNTYGISLEEMLGNFAPVQNGL